MNPDLDHVLESAIAALDGAGVRWALVGGLAVSAWASPRATRDVDLYADLQEVAPSRLQEKLESHGFVVPAMEEELRTYGVFRCRSGEAGVFLDVFSSTGPLGRAILDRRVEVDDGERKLWLISPEDLAILKAFSERERDFEDLVQILRVQEDTLDMDYIEQWTRLLDAGIESDEVTERMDRAVALARSGG